ncbi:S1/P1 Nuclease [Polynucleobacter meluiroseus]|uniref:S1/P1 Nuclease n=1 Tax=Polynucleobacter meluiroseus TaxID=1938814 RepID=A0A240E2S7_9BURK|nr:S1/P1 nuclease [Polynucleobacter meluiroseus]SNX29180.1 S1/P1 Nuclease [Polynucleobacter meluiroseus]
MPTSPLLKFSLCLISLIAYCQLNTALAWGIEGHQVIAAIAQENLTPRAALEVKRLLATESNATLISISTWADENKTRANAPWHYVNYPSNSCEYITTRDCPDQACVIGALEVQTRVLASNVSDEKRLLALKWVTHLMGDIHQPLHASHKEDRGGGTYQVQAFGKETNLHAVWDIDLINNLQETTPALSARLLANQQDVQPITTSIPINIALESCKIVHKADFYPARTLDQQYLSKYTSILEARLWLAGQRLAQLLNNALQ